MARFVLLLLAAFVMISITNGHRVCPFNEVWNDCGTACPLTCTDPEPRPCTMQCVAGCQCKDGLVRHDRWGLCVPKKWCCL